LAQDETSAFVSAISFLRSSSRNCQLKEFWGCCFDS
jgi:hypothetical protein